MTDDLEDGQAPPRAVRSVGAWVFGGVLALCGLFMVALALAVYHDRRETHMTLSAFIAVFTVGCVSLAGGGWVVWRLDAVEARAVARARADSAASWSEAGPALIAATGMQPGRPVTVCTRFARTQAILSTVLVGTLLVTTASQLHPRSAAVAAVAFAVAAAAVGCYRCWRTALRISADGVEVRNYFRTYRFRSSEVRCFTDGEVTVGEDHTWALRVILIGGRQVTASATSSARTKGVHKTMATIVAAAECYAIPTELTGIAPPRSRRIRRQLQRSEDHRRGPD